MAYQLNMKKPYVEVFGEVDPNEKDKDGNHHIEHRYRQYGMMFDGQGELIGPELDVPPDNETEAQMRDRITKEVRLEVERENRENLAQLAKQGNLADNIAGTDTVLVGKPHAKK